MPQRGNSGAALAAAGRAGMIAAMEAVRFRAGRPVFRFAPSPNGQLHLGHALSALTNERFARRLDGALLLRLEDIDVVRCRPEFAQGVQEDLAWLGLRFDGPVRRQSLHFADYAAALATLRERGLVYPCFCSRGRIRMAVAAAGGTVWPRDPDGSPLYPRLCRALPAAEAARRIAAGEPHAWRLEASAAAAASAPGLSYGRFDDDFAQVQVAARPQRWGDTVLARRDTPTSYHLAVVVDDALQGVSHVVRGRDLEAATDLHVLLQHLLALPVPRYHFHALLLDTDGAKLAKSRSSPSLASLRSQGVSAAAIRARLGFT